MILYLAVNKILTLFCRSFAYFWVTMAYMRAPIVSTEPRSRSPTVRTQVRNANATRKIECNPSTSECDPRSLGFFDNVFREAAYSLADMTLPILDGRCGRHRARPAAFYIRQTTSYHSETYSIF